MVRAVNARRDRARARLPQQRSRRSFSMSLVGAWMLLPGCGYLQDRHRDLLHVLWADIGYGLGLGVDFQITDAVHSGIAFNVITEKVGLQREIAKPWTEHGLAFLIGRSVVDGIKDGTTIRDGFLFNRAAFSRPWPDIPLHHNRQRPWLSFLDVDVGVYALVASRVGFSPGELVDFLLGWFGIDIGADDLTSPWAIREDDDEESEDDVKAEDGREIDASR